MAQLKLWTLSCCLLFVDHLSPSGLLLGNHLFHPVGPPGGIVAQGTLPCPVPLDMRPKTGLGIGILDGGVQDWELTDLSGRAKQKTELGPPASPELPSGCPFLAWTFKFPP